MKLRILGCSGGIGAGKHTTSMLLDGHTLIDAGTGVGELTHAELCAIDHIFLTHAHLDHIVSIPFLVDTVARKRTHPVIVHALPEVITALQAHIFNWMIWPDFSRIPNTESPLMRYQAFHPDDCLDLNGCKIRPLPVDHVVPAVGFHLDSGQGSLVFTGDTTDHDPLWQEINRIENLRHLIIETAFPDKERNLALLAKHLCPGMLGQVLKKLSIQAQIHITHLKPDSAETIMRETNQVFPAAQLHMLADNDILEF